MAKITTLITLLIISCIAHDVYAGDPISITRQGRRVEIDGFLLEWDLGAARRWHPSSPWTWDAVNTADGLAGYFALHAAQQACTAAVSEETPDAPLPWTFAVTAVNTGKSIKFTVPNQVRGENFAFDVSSFESDGYYIMEWIVPWNFWGNGGGANRYTLTLNGHSACNDTLPTIILTAAPKSARSSGSWAMYVTMLLAGVMTLALVSIRRRGRRNKSFKNFLT
ncbi:MAG: hypothetical protein LBU70_08640 [Chitinispirillales bacterium]|jgi:hypothetical protein|nr:hypothetical protein [Chitinispirillales bacterium]